jgi:hypothetical protein
VPDEEKTDDAINGRKDLASIIGGRGVLLEGAQRLFDKGQAVSLDTIGNTVA